MISVAIQAGGESRRMGQDKALLPFLGESLLERVMKRVNLLGDELLVTTNHPERFLDFGVPLIQDELPGKGALGGLLTALHAAQFSTVIVVACDMPFVNPKILADACDQLHSKQADVVVPHTENGYEPLHAVYRRETCLPAIRAALEAGERRLISWFPSVNVIPIAKDDLIKYDPHRIAFWNVNTPEDLHQAEELAAELGE
jgi:molybdopterin-guanine dinucleotide biosynthesis protein A